MTSASTRLTRSRVWLAPACGLAVVLLAGCGDGGVSLPTPSGSLSIPSISVSRPSVSIPSGTTEPSVIVPESPTPEPSDEPSTEPPDETPTPDETTPEPTDTPTRTKTPAPTKSVVVTQTVTPTAEDTPTPSETPTATPSPSVSAAGEPVDDDDGGVPAWLWWVLAAVLAALAAWLAVQARRRNAWDAELAPVEAEIDWFGRELLPQLQQTGTPDALAGGWHVSAARVEAAEDRLTGLEASAPDQTRAARARTLRDAVRTSRSDVDTLVANRDQASTPVVLAEATTRLLAALDPPPTHR
jgi:hypothetical protein